MATVMLLLSNGAFLNAQVTVGSDKTPEKFSLLELVSGNNKGLRLPQIPTTIARNAISDAHGTDPEMMGLQIFNMETQCVETWNGNTWISQCFDVSTATFDIDSTTLANLLPGDGTLMN